MLERSACPSDLSNLEYALVAELIPQPKRVGPPAKYEWCEIVNGVRYVLRTGYASRLLPYDLPKWNAVYHYVSTWRHDGILKRVLDHLHGDRRQSVGRNRQPRAASIDSQSRKTTAKAETWKRLRLLRADGAHARQLVAWVRSLRKRRRVRQKIVKRSDDINGFHALPRCWVVESPTPIEHRPRHGSTSNARHTSLPAAPAECWFSKVAAWQMTMMSMMSGG